MVMLIVHGSDKHRIVKVEDKGVVDYYRPRTQSGDLQHLLSVTIFFYIDSHHDLGVVLFFSSRFCRLERTWKKYRSIKILYKAFHDQGHSQGACLHFKNRRSRQNKAGDR